MRLKNLLLVVVVLVDFNTGWAQLQIGPKIGIQGSRAQFDQIIAHGDSIQSMFKPGYSVGMVVNYDVTKRFSVKNSLSYVNKGKEIKGEFDRDLRHTASYHFIEIPILFSVTFIRPKYRYYFMAGPHISYWMGGSGNYVDRQLAADGEEFAYKVSFDENVSEGSIWIDRANRLQFGLDFGGGINLPAGRGKNIAIELKYSYGHTNMGKVNSSSLGSRTYSDSMEFTNHAISVSGAYLLDLNLKSWRKGKSTLRSK